MSSEVPGDAGPQGAVVLESREQFFFRVKLSSTERLSLWLRKPWRLPPRTVRRSYTARAAHSQAAGGLTVHTGRSGRIS